MFLSKLPEYNIESNSIDNSACIHESISFDDFEYQTSLIESSLLDLYNQSLTTYAKVNAGILNEAAGDTEQKSISQKIHDLWTKFIDLVERVIKTIKDKIAKSQIIKNSWLNAHKGSLSNLKLVNKEIKHPIHENTLKAGLDKVNLDSLILATRIERLSKDNVTDEMMINEAYKIFKIELSNISVNEINNKMSQKILGEMHDSFNVSTLTISDLLEKANGDYLTKCINILNNFKAHISIVNNKNIINSNELIKETEDKIRMDEFILRLVNSYVNNIKILSDEAYICLRIAYNTSHASSVEKNKPIDAKFKQV